jgi:hypothetical protein
MGEALSGAQMDSDLIPDPTSACTSPRRAHRELTDAGPLRVLIMIAPIAGSCLF